MTGTRLGVWLHEIEVAELYERKWPRIQCRYTEEALHRWPANSPVISCSLPLRPEPMDATAFCAGLLPEGRALETMATAANIPVTNQLELLARYGRDVAGALVITASEPQPKQFGVAPYTDDDLRRAVEELDEHPLGAHDDSELSLAGLQDKLLLVQTEDGGWGRPLRGRPSTHILKLDDRRFPGLIAAEAHCLLLARAARLTDVAVETTKLGDADCLIVSRFDRETVDGEVRRIHQEDLCQATGIDPRNRRGRAKYERAGGPSLRQAAAILEGYARDPLAELDRLVATVTYTVLIGNADAHGKNLALLHPRPNEVTLAPLYDTVPTLLWPQLRTDAAMSVGGHASMVGLEIDDIVSEAVAWNHPGDRAREVAIETATLMLDAVEGGAIPSTSRVAELVASRAKQLLAGQPLGTI